MSAAAPRPLSALRGIGPARAARLGTLGIASVEDLLLLAPLRHEDRRAFHSLRQLAALPPGEKGTVRVKVVESRLIRTRRRGFSLVRAAVSDGETQETAVWFNQPYLARHLAPGRELILHGDCKPSRGRGRPRQMENPELEMLPAEAGPEDAIHMGRVVPVYRRVGPLSGRMLRRLMHQALQDLPPGAAADPLPEEMRARLALPGRAAALHALHFPEGTVEEGVPAAATAARRRLAFEELLLLCLALERKRRQRRASRRGFAYQVPPDLRARMARLLPFPLTPGQREAIRCIGQDLRSPAPMARLLQGDVGSGKTLVAMLTMWLAAENGQQAALMVPTEVLAEQQHRVAEELLRPAGHPVGLLTGRLPAPRRREVKRALAAGRVRLVVGTHALIQDDVAFHRLGLVIVDEQHRFGVGQRLRLAAKGREPDLLIMTATPIPRSLALTRYGDLDHAEIRDRPPGRVAVATEVLPASRRDEAWQAVREVVAEGNQAFIVYPLLEEGGPLGRAAARRAHQDLAAGPLAGIALGLVHGRMPGEKRQEVMESFATGRLPVLVSTSVVEVGVDVPGATLMVVEHAERFGLAQLHQLRGRVGRGTRPGRCLLLQGPQAAPEAQERLRLLAETDDGFAIARLDLALRGPGEVLGERQHGEADLRLAHPARDADLLDAAREWAVDLSRADLPSVLEQAVQARWGRRLGLLAGG